MEFDLSVSYLYHIVSIVDCCLLLLNSCLALSMPLIKSTNVAWNLLRLPKSLRSLFEEEGTLF